MKKLLYILLFTFISYNSIIAQCFSHISTSYNHNVAQKTDGSIWTWGWDGWLQMPNTSGWDEQEPIPLSTLNNWLIIKAGQHNTFAINSNGSLWGIGGNNHGELGVGNTISDSDFKQIGTANNWKFVAPGGEQTVGIKTDNTLWAWGANYAYQVGDGSTTQRNAPIQISTTSDWKTAASCSLGVSFAIKNNGTLWGWGLNVAGLCGYSSAWIVPTQHNVDTDWDKMSMGAAHILALKTNGTLWAWGNAGNGETGQVLVSGGGVDLAAPFQIAGNWKAVAAGEGFSMGIKTNGTLWAWGKNDVGQLGDGTTTNRYIPIQLGTATNWDSVSCGFQHTVALRTDGSLWSWGTNDYGQLGNGTTTAVSIPTLVPVAGCTLANEAFVVADNVLLVIPNPAKSKVAITYKGLNANATIELYDITGRNITNYTTTANEGSWILQTNTYPAGIYIVVVRSNNIIVTQRKLIIQ
jgi:alpha-tubulin suppressor-like RCC1 family protein